MACANRVKIDGMVYVRVTDTSLGRRLQYAHKLGKITPKQWLSAHNEALACLDPAKRQAISNKEMKALVLAWLNAPKSFKTNAKNTGIKTGDIEAKSETSIKKVAESYLSEFCQPQANSRNAMEKANRQCGLLLEFLKSNGVANYGLLTKKIAQRYPEWRNSKSRGGKAAADTINQEYRRLACIIRHGVKYHGWRDNYALDGVNVKHTTENTKAVRPFEIGEVKTILAWLAANSSLYLHDMALLAICAGLEAKALTLLQKEWFKPDLGILRVYDKLVSGVYDAKTQNRARDIPLTSTLIKILKRGYAFRRPNGTATPIHDYSRKTFARCERETGISNVDWHRFRHTCATARLSAGWQLVRVSRMLGHSNVNTTASHYAEYDLSASVEGFEGMVKVYADFVKWLDCEYFAVVE
jgi:integrase